MRSEEAVRETLDELKRELKELEESGNYLKYPYVVTGLVAKIRTLEWVLGSGEDEDI